MDLIFFVLIICAWFLTAHLKASVPIHKDQNTDDMNKTFNKSSVSLNELNISEASKMIQFNKFANNQSKYRNINIKHTIIRMLNEDEIN